MVQIHVRRSQKFQSCEDIIRLLSTASDVHIMFDDIGLQASFLADGERQLKNLMQPFSSSDHAWYDGGISWGNEQSAWGATPAASSGGLGSPPAGTVAPRFEDYTGGRVNVSFSPPPPQVNLGAINPAAGPARGFIGNGGATSASSAFGIHSSQPARAVTMEDTAAQKIGAHLRGKLVRESVERMKEEMNTAAAKIAALFKGKLDRQMVEKMRQEIQNEAQQISLEIRSQFSEKHNSRRGATADEQDTSSDDDDNLELDIALNDRVRVAVLKIEELFKSKLDRQEMAKVQHEMNSAATFIKAYFRGNRERAEVRRMKFEMVNAASKIQTAFRTRIAEGRPVVVPEETLEDIGREEEAMEATSSAETANGITTAQSIEGPQLAQDRSAGKSTLRTVDGKDPSILWKSQGNSGLPSANRTPAAARTPQIQEQIAIDQEIHTKIREEIESAAKEIAIQLEILEKERAAAAEDECSDVCSVHSNISKSSRKGKASVSTPKSANKYSPTSAGGLNAKSNTSPMAADDKSRGDKSESLDELEDLDEGEAIFEDVLLGEKMDIIKGETAAAATKIAAFVRKRLFLKNPARARAETARIKEEMREAVKKIEEHFRKYSGRRREREMIESHRGHL